MACKYHSALFLNGERIWSNPVGLGHAWIKVRKQILEEEIIERMFERAQEREWVLSSHPEYFA